LRRVEVDADGIATVTLRAETSMNIVGSAAIGGLIEAVEALREEPAVRVLVLRGAGDRAFIGGADIREMAELEPASARAFIGRLRDLCEAVRTFPVPVVARLSGWTLGGGLEVAMACDLRVSSTEATYGMPEVKIGIPSVIHAALMPRLIGASRASWMLLTGETIDARTAHGWGLVHSLHEPDALDGAVHAAATQLAGLPPRAVRAQKRLLRAWEALPVDEAIEASVTEFGAAFETGEPRAAMEAFLNRPRPGRRGS
jgi:enoyl-CoA hydratase/carnithine racemase